MNMTGRIRNYIFVTKPGIIAGNLTSTAGGLFLASGGSVEPKILLSTLAGVGLVVAAGCVCNNCFDRNIDGRMTRTRNRVMARGLMSPRSALIYATLLSVSGTLLLGATTNILCVGIVLAGLILYGGIYSLYLKRSSVHATLIGSLAGAVPPLAGYCAISNRFDTGAAILLAIFCLWQVPHSYAIGIYHFQDYAAAAIPMLPVKHGVDAAKKHIISYIPAFLAATLLLTLTGYTGLGFLAAVAIMGMLWFAIAWAGLTTDDNRIWARRVFVFSLLTIIVLNVMLSIDSTCFNPQPGEHLVSAGSLPY